MAKKSLCLVLTLLIAVCCVPFGAGAAEPARRQVKALLPTSLPVLEELLDQAAAAEGMELVVKRAAPGTEYVEQLAADEEAGDTHDICWIEGEAAALALYERDVSMMDLNAAAAGTLMQSLSRTVPDYARLLNKQSVYGLPVGTYASGTLVNLPLLGALLNAKDLNALERDLVNCSFDEWDVLLSSVRKYLARPEPLTLTLNGTPYTFPSFRAEKAKELRGTYAAPTAASGSAYANEIDAALALAFDGPDAFATAEPGARDEKVGGVLDTLFSAVDFTSSHAAGSAGVLLRGEGFATAAAIDDQAAETMFAEGKALFLRGDTVQGRRIEAEHPTLQNCLSIIPAKLPAWDAAAEAINTELAVNTAGVLGVSLRATAKSDAVTVLLRLFSSGQGRREIETRMYLWAFSDLAPAGRLFRDIDVATGSGAYYVPAQERRKTLAQSGRLSKWVGENLMTKAVWEAADKTSFHTAARGIVAVG